MRRLVVLALAGALVTGAALPSLADHDNGKGKGHAYGHTKPTKPTSIPTRNGCVGDPQTLTLLEYPVAGQTARALYALPSVKPRGIVVFDHGYGHTMYSWMRHMKRISSQLGVITVTPNYRGQVDDYSHGTPLPTSRGWRVQEGAADTNAVAQLFDRMCLKGKGHNVLYGVSMGGNTSGLALAANPRRVTGTPLWDEWIDVEGAVNLLETYQLARVLAPANAFAANAVADIEQEAGGSFEEKPGRYRELTVVTRGAELKASGVKGVIILHGVMDGLVSHDESRQLQAVLRAQGIPVDLRSFVTKTSASEPGTTVDGYLPIAHMSPFAGHASEASETHDVGRAGFAALAELYRGYKVGCRDSLSDGFSGYGGTAYDGCA